MLKRQRPASPPPSNPTVPLVVDSPPFYTDARRDFKRRRLLPPSLDGHSRGWAVADAGDGVGDDDEIMSSEEEAVEGNGDTPVWAAHTSEYQKANNVLHELHALHQHRLIFSSNSHPSPSQHSPLGTSSPRHSKVIMPQPPLMDPAFAASGDGCSTSHPPKDEVDRVIERYEDTNRLLGSLFLSRRRQLDAVDEDHSKRPS